MKTTLFNFRAPVLTLGIGLAIFVSGCGRSAQQKAYEQAAQKEQQLTAENTAALIAEFKQVITRQSGTEWAAKAQAHVAALEAKAKTEELHKSVFQEHGVD
jgi:NAD/NADP transhydrogenase beta subunit